MSLTDSHWLKEYNETNPAFKVGVGVDMSADMYAMDTYCEVCVAVIDMENEEYASGYVDKHGSYYLCEECKS
jgi:pectate lyase